MRFLHLSTPFLLSALIGCGSATDQSNQDNLDDKGSPELAHSARSLSPSSSCLTGGVTVQAGIDTNSNGVLDPEEATDTFDICLNAPIAETNPPLILSDPADAEACPNGGITILIGKDLNNDEQLGDNEVTTTSHVCNGQDGVDGANGNDGNDTPVPIDRSDIFQVSTTYEYNNPDNPICVNGTYATTIQITEYELGDEFLEHPLRQCFQNQCGSNVENGNFYYSEMGGDEGCFEYAQTSYSCDPGYQFNPVNYACQRAPGGTSNGNVCDLLDCSTEAICTEVGGLWNGTQCNSICRIGEIRTSRGCETSINTCALEDSVLDNQCVENTFTTIQPETMDLCGYIVEDYRLEAGEYLATCDVSFLGKTILEAGVSIKVDAKWDISFAAVTIKGTEANPVSIFGRNGVRMGDLTMNGIYNKITDPTVGNPSAGSIQHLSALNFTSITISNNKIAHSEFTTVDGAIKLNNVSTDTNVFETGVDEESTYSARIEMLNSLSKNDRFGSVYFYAKDSILWGASGPHLQLENTERSETREHLLHTKQFPPMIFDSIFNNGRCTNYDGEGPYNMSAAPHSDCDSRYKLYTSYVFVNKSKELTVSPGQSFEVSLLSFDETGPILDPGTITWKAYYYRDGVQVSVENEWTGNPATISLDKIESYYIYPVGKTSINGSYTVNVY